MKQPLPAAHKGRPVLPGQAGGAAEGQCLPPGSVPGYWSGGGSPRKPWCHCFDDFQLTPLTPGSKPHDPTTSRHRTSSLSVSWVLETVPQPSAWHGRTWGSHPYPCAGRGPACTCVRLCLSSSRQMPPPARPSHHQPLCSVLSALTLIPHTPQVRPGRWGSCLNGSSGTVTASGPCRLHI